MRAQFNCSTLAATVIERQRSIQGTRDLLAGQWKRRREEETEALSRALSEARDKLTVLPCTSILLSTIESLPYLTDAELHHILGRSVAPAARYGCCIGGRHFPSLPEIQYHTCQEERANQTTRDYLLFPFPLPLWLNCVFPTSRFLSPQRVWDVESRVLTG
jgi:hypothetical protein